MSIPNRIAMMRDLSVVSEDWIFDKKGRQLEKQEQLQSTSV